jgi:hypothetical protein
MTLDVTNAVVLDRSQLERTLDSRFVDIEKSILEKDQLHAFYLLGKIQVYMYLLNIENSDPRYLTIIRLIKHAFNFDLTAEDNNDN